VPFPLIGTLENEVRMKSAKDGALRSKGRLFGLACCLALIPPLGGCQSSPAHADQQAREAARARVSEGKALFEEKCRTVAGEKIYKTVPNVEGIVLLKIRPPRGDRELSDRMWPGAAFARESAGDEYIETFLGFEYAPGDGLTGKPGAVTASNRGYIATDRRPGGLPGYQFVDVVEDGKRYRYSGRWEEPWHTDKSYLRGYIKFVLEKTLTASPAPRYGVTYEDYVDPRERALGIASSTIKVVDLQTNEVLGKLTRYAWSPAGPSAANPVPWLTAYRCPDYAVGTNAATRKFVDQVLIPWKGE
jgi:hypothetical protein